MANATQQHLAIKVRMTQDCPLQQGMLDMMLMLMVTGVLAIARHLLSVCTRISAQQHLLTSGARVHLRGVKANAIEALAKTVNYCDYLTKRNEKKRLHQLASI